MLLDFSEIPANRPPKTCLACPKHWKRTDADMETPTFPVGVDRLREALVAVATREPRTETTALDEEAQQAAFVQRSAVLRFPDDITVQFEALSAERSTLGIYSRARLGYYDLGVNRERVSRWLHALAAKVGSGTAER